jgi:poly-gamma-glutamate capsule biosynthesis protein CapA/YwtB (metallophosphatase superfamily)
MVPKTNQTPPDGFDWRSGTWSARPGRQVEAEIVVSSDWAPIRTFAPIVAGSPEAVYGDLLPVLRAADLRLTNLECPLTALEQPVWKSGSVLRGGPEHVVGLTAVPFEVVTLGNNHVFDYGVEGFRQTQQLLADHRIQSVGAGLTPEEAHRPLTVKVKGISIGIVSFGEGEDLTTAVDGPGVFGWELTEVLDCVRTLRREVDVVLVMGHCGVEYVPFPPPYVAAAFQRIAEAGADLVVGHHPHVSQGIQVHRGVPIAYSLGNFVFFQETDLLYRKLGYLLKVGLARGSVARLEIVPYQIEDRGLRQLRGDRLAWFLERLERISSPLAEEQQIRDAWHGFLRHYGHQGFVDEVRRILDSMAREPRKGAAMFRNRLTTMQHQEHWIDLLSRMVEGTLESSPEWARELAQEWLTTRCGALPP